MTYERNVGQQKMRQLFTSGKRYNLVYGGSRSGKTFEIIGTVLERALLAAGSRHLIVRQEGTSVKRAIVKGTWPEVVALRWPGVDYHWNEQYGYFTLPNGSEVWVGGLNDDKSLEKILGNEYDTIYINEASEVKYLAFTLLRSRLANMTNTIEGESLSQRFYVDLNPTTRQHWTYRLWMDGVDPDTDTNVDISQYGSVIVNPYDNKDNLSAEYIKDLESLPPAARKRFLEGEYVADAEHALWRRETIHRTQKPPELTRIVVAIDPAVSNEAGSDETGLVVTGIDAGGNGYVLCDDSGKYRPEEWARRAIGLYHQFDADRVVAEVNQGGDMVENTVRAIDPNVPYRAVRATRGKYVRAEPVAALYERGLINHAGKIDKLEQQKSSYKSD
jgi:PBSX family phage terminase large subunit